MSTYIAHLGSFPQLAWQEILAVSVEDTVRFIGDTSVSVELESDQQAQDLLRVLGGTVKISRLLATVEQADIEVLAQAISADQADQDKRIQFAVAEIGRDHLPKIEAQDVKNRLQELGFSSRFVEGSRSGLSASVLLHQKQVQEFNLINTDKGTLLTKTVAIQDIDLWTTKDRGKPYADRKKGMLPPKVARMMLNLAIRSMDAAGTVILDPFCGTGTVLIEAADRGVSHVYGSDSDADAVNGARANFNWAVSVLPTAQTTSGNFYQAEVAHINQLGLKGVTHIVTEPFLGKQTPQPQQLVNIFKGLEKLYFGAFKEWTKILQDGSRVVIIFPEPAEQHLVKNWQHTWQALIDKLATLGYTTTSEPLMYARPGAVIKRQIYQFTFAKK